MEWCVGRTLRFTAIKLMGEHIGSPLQALALNLMAVTLRLLALEGFIRLSPSFVVLLIIQMTMRRTWFL